jgi:thioredoxin 1
LKEVSNVSENVRVFTTANWEEEVLKAAGPVLVDFWAEWCPPCRALAPRLESVAKSYEGRIKIGKLNVDENDAIAGTYGVRSIPTLLLFREGKVVEQRVGALPLPELTLFLDSHAGAPVQA